MAFGIVIHINAANKVRTDFFVSERVRIGSDETSDVKLAVNNLNDSVHGTWLELERVDKGYRVSYFHDFFEFCQNSTPLVYHAIVHDGDSINSNKTDVSFQFFLVPATQSMASSNHSKEAHIIPFVENAAIEAAATPKRDDAKIFLREFTFELLREISWLTKLFILTLMAVFVGGILYIGYSVYQELKLSRERAEEQHQLIERMAKQLDDNNQEITRLGQSNKKLMDTLSLAPTLRNEYYKGICLIVGTYDLVDKSSGRPLRYPDASTMPTPDPFEPQFSEEGITEKKDSPLRLTTEGNGSVVEYDFVGTGFHVGSGYIVTNRHVVQPWTEDDQVKSLAQISNGRARLKRLVIYFPDLTQPFPLKLKQISTREDLAVGSIDPLTAIPEIPALPLADDSDPAVGVGKTVVTMGYPNGPDRLLAMVDEAEARSIQTKYGSSLQSLISYLAQSQKISPLTTTGAITDLDSKKGRIVHDAKTAVGGSGAPLFGQSARVIGVNFGVFAENNAANMAVPIRYAIEMLKKAGWKSPEQLQQEAQKQQQMANANTNTPPTTQNQP